MANLWSYIGSDKGSERRRILRAKGEQDEDCEEDELGVLTLFANYSTPLMVFMD
jgi:hypothetical protein